MATVSERLRLRVRTEFGAAADAVLVLLARVPEEFPGGGSQDPERLQAAVALDADGDPHRVAQRVITGVTDWRDLLVGSRLAHADWRAVLDLELGCPPAGRRWTRRQPRFRPRS